MRGGIVDLFPPNCEHPIRIDFFGDEIEELRYFTVADQRTIEPVSGSMIVYPCKELMISDEVKKKAAYLAAEFPLVAEMAEKISLGMSVEGMESLAGALKPELKSLLSFLPKNFSVIVVDGARANSRSLDLINTNQEFLEASWSTAAMGGKSPIDLTHQLNSGGYFNLAELRDEAASSGRTWRELKADPAILDRRVASGQWTKREADRTWRILITWDEARVIAQVRKWYPQGVAVKEPRYWHDDAFNNPSQPVVGICWYEAMAYAAWLATITGQPYRRPTEPEWEWAARRGGRLFPWGGGWDTDRLNSLEGENRVMRTTPVGAS